MPQVWGRHERICDIATLPKVPFQIQQEILTMVDIQKTGFGWISSSGEFFPCEMYDHWSTLRKIVGSEIQLEMDRQEERLQEIEKECQELADSGEHPEWHVYECAESDAEADVIKLMYKKGWVRIGTNKRAGILGAEGTPEAIKNHYQLLKDMEEQSGYVLDVTPRK